jgi:hypothetical protein
MYLLVTVSRDVSCDSGELIERHNTWRCISKPYTAVCVVYEPQRIVGIMRERNVVQMALMFLWRSFLLRQGR